MHVHCNSTHGVSCTCFAAAANGTRVAVGNKDHLKQMMDPTTNICCQIVVMLIVILQYLLCARRHSYMGCVPHVEQQTLAQGTPAALAACQE